MRDRGFNRTTLQCRIKVKKLRQKYMAIRDKLWCNEILGTSPCANPLNFIDGRSFDMEDEDENATDDDNNSSSSSISIDDSSIPSTESAVETSDVGTSSSHPKKSSLLQITTLISSVTEHQKKDHHLFLLKEEEWHQRELELEQERYKLQMELEERRHRAQMEHDQAMTRMLCQVMNSAITNTFPPIHTRLYPTEEPSFHTLPIIHQPSASVTGQGVGSTSSSEQTLSSILHELSNSDK
ncbi:hypothetical protein ABG768_018726 [Culter alburnus]|uniref:Uncharacterized protein n=1 Tax=Culter alburnus TaxID=194366 RepID=A0AAW2AXS3_CULAL